MAEPRPETLELATALVALAADLEAGRSAAVEPATLRRAGDLLAAKPADSVPSASVPARILELATRLVAPGPKAAHVSASECHELRDFIHALAAQQGGRDDGR